MTENYRYSIRSALIRLLDYSLISQMLGSNTDGRRSTKHSRCDPTLKKAPSAYHTSRNSKNEDLHLKYWKAVGSWSRNIPHYVGGRRRRIEIFRIGTVSSSIRKCVRIFGRLNCTSF
ncbi:hypothetical protein KSF78_0007460 [Schistosoma japonicum]|nr:hypothetical protein KSF78_0007460 [Schistosoma japonicum]